MSSGNVGIGTTGIAGSSNAFNLKTTGATSVITALANGNVGIGTTNPLNILTIGKNTTEDTIVRIQSKNYAGLEIAGDTGNNNTTEPGGSYIEISNDGGASSGIFGLTQRPGEDGSGTVCTGTSTNAVVFGNRGTPPLQFIVNGDVKQTIISTGNVGIGTTNPLQTLHVNGATRSTNPAISDSYVAFYATATTQNAPADTNTKLTTNATLTWSTNYSNSIFTAPYNGIYTFTVAIKVSVASTAVFSQLYINGVVISPPYTNAGYIPASGLNAANGTWVLKLNAGDDAEAYWRTTTASTIGDGYFCGSLLQRII